VKKRIEWKTYRHAVVRASQTNLYRHSPPDDLAKLEAENPHSYLYLQGAIADDPMERYDLKRSDMLRKLGYKVTVQARARLIYRVGNVQSEVRLRTSAAIKGVKGRGSTEF
jgi:hypothetical protein